MQRTLIKNTPKLIGKEVVLKGWVDSKRDHGKVTFIDLRDNGVIIQCVGVNQMGEVTPESVLEIKGKVKSRPEKLINKNLVTGEVEIEVLEYKILNKCDELPIPIDTDGLEINEESRLKFRYLDLRRERLQKNMKSRSKLTKAFRDELEKQDFIEIETPMLTESTKEGSRDFVVPSRLQPGKFYALPQSPQQYKQLLMTAGFEKYFQFARCIRDEDLRADRGFEHTQLDLEMSFVTQEDVMRFTEKLVIKAMTDLGVKLKDNKFPIFSYKQAIKQFKSDKFDLRTEFDKKEGVLAFAWVIDFPFFKKVDKSDLAEVRDGKSGWTFTHNPFSNPKPEFLDDHKSKKNIENILTAQYDLVCNGHEIGGGSIRAHDPEVLISTFKIMGYTDKEIEQSVGHMLQAFKLGTPPHGGIALGLDRLVMLLNHENSLKEAIAFPMLSSGKTAVMNGPSEICQEQLKELNLA